MEKIKQIFDQIKILREELNNLKKIEIEKHHIKIGDKVEVETYRGKIICFVGDVKLQNDLSFDYEFKKVKKDGTKSRFSESIYLFKSIKKL